jgi:DNA-binding NarL/FixJ family response regulator
MPEHIRTIIVDDHAVFRAGLIKLLEAKPEVEIVGEIDSGDDVIPFLEKNSTDLVILDISLPGTNGLKLLDQIKKKRIKTKILILSMHKVADYCRLALKHGAVGYILKEDAFDQVIKAIEAIHQGERYISPAMKSAAAETFLHAEDNMLPELLTKTERVVVRYIAEGMSNKEVAKIMDISVRTVETHRAHILKKIKVKNTAGLVQYAIKHGFVKLNHLSDN